MSLRMLAHPKTSQAHATLVERRLLNAGALTVRRAALPLGTGGYSRRHSMARHRPHKDAGATGRYELPAA